MNFAVTGEPVEDMPEEDEQIEPEDPDLADEDDMADFIVSESEDEVDGDGVRVRYGYGVILLSSVQQPYWQYRFF